MQNFPIHRQLNEFIEKASGENWSHAKTIHELKHFARRVHTLEGVHERKRELLHLAVEAGNELFEFFSDIVIDDMFQNDREKEVEALREYLRDLMKNNFAPHSAGMMICWEDKLLEKRQ